jgi:hypothetical protein
VASFIVGPVKAQTPDRKFSIAGIEHANEVRSFLASLQEGIKQHNLETVSDMVSVPIKIFTAHGQIQIESKKELMRRFDDVFDQDVSKVILCQRFENLGVTHQGILAGRGVIYFGLSFQGNRKDFNFEKDSNNLNDRRFWKLKVVGINGGSRAHKEAEACLQ